MCNFIWTGSIENIKLVLVSWRRCCILIKEGGLGIRNLFELNAAMLLKFCWRIMQSKKFIPSILHQKYISESHLLRHGPFTSTIWNSFKFFYNQTRDNCLALDYRLSLEVVFLD
ncbi:hypothetical protein M5689_004014 [Euphorbia peplus]|nr:hypothetical protein M5689_004014 [Euphorbia peplus]